MDFDSKVAIVHKWRMGSLVGKAGIVSSHIELLVFADPFKISHKDMSLAVRHKITHLAEIDLDPHFGILHDLLSTDSKVGNLVVLDLLYSSQVTRV